MKPTNFAIDHAVAVYVLILMVVVGGFMAYQSLPRESAPDVTIPLVVVSTVYYGVAPADIESLVTQPLERELKGLKDVDEITSASAEGVSIVTVKFEPNVDIDDALQKIREKVDAAEPDLPPDAEDPTVTEINFSELPIILVNLFGEADQVLLKRVAEDLQDEFEGIQGVLDVVITGGLEREIQVFVKPRQLEHFGLSLTDVINTLQRENVNLPGGSVDMGSLSYLVRIDGEFKTAQPIRDLVIKDVEGQPIYVRDVAEVVDGFKEPTTYSRFQGETNVSLSIQKRAGENLIRITDEVKSILAKYQKDKLPNGVKVAVTADNSKQVRSMVSDLENNILTGLILV
ncbi:MAG: efflux RND transporter permease subunit, partial [Myxococcota bacterium]